MKEFYIHQPIHLGDCFYISHLLYNIVKNNQNYKFHLYIRSKYLKEVKFFLQDVEDSVFVHDQGKIRHVNKTIISGWIGSQEYVSPLLDLKDNYHLGIYEIKRKRRVSRHAYCLNHRYGAFFDLLCKDYFKIDNPLDHHLSLVLNEYAITIKPEILLEDIEMLIINSPGLSKQYRPYAPETWKRFIELASKQYKCAQTFKHDEHFVEKVPCTWDYKYNLCNIGFLSKNVKYIVGIVTSPLIPCFNIWNIDSVQKFVSLSNRHVYSYNDKCIRQQRIEYLPISLREFLEHKGDHPTFDYIQRTK